MLRRNPHITRWDILATKKVMIVRWVHNLECWARLTFIYLTIQYINFPLKNSHTRLTQKIEWFRNVQKHKLMVLCTFISARLSYLNTRPVLTLKTQTQLNLSSQKPKKTGNTEAKT